MDRDEQIWSMLSVVRLVVQRIIWGASDKGRRKPFGDVYFCCFFDRHWLWTELLDDVKIPLWNLS